MTVLLAAAVIPPIYLMVYIYRKDKIEKEPAGLIVRLFIFGCVSMIAAALVESVLFEQLAGVVNPNSIGYLLIEYFLCVGLVEEFLKYAALRLASWRNPAFNYCFDGVVYSVAAAMGFAALENISYIGVYGLSVALTRAVTAIPLHCICGIFRGYYYGMAKYHLRKGRRDRSSRNRWLAILIPTLIHGFYDFCAASGIQALIPVFWVNLIVLDILALRAVNRYARLDRMI